MREMYPFGRLVQRESLPDGEVFRLPPRERQNTFGVALFLLIFGVSFAIGPAVVVGGVGAAKFGPYGALAFVVGLPFMGVGALIAAMGAAILWGHTEIEVRNGRLTAIERLGPFRVRRSRETRNIATLEIVGDGFRVNGKPVQTAGGDDFAVLRAKIVNAKAFAITAMYPKAMLRALAHDVADLCDAQTADRLVGDTDGPNVVEIDSEYVVKDGRRVVPLVPAPEDTRIEVERVDGAMTLRLPAPGLRTGSKGFFHIAILWNLFMALFAGAFMYAFFYAPQKINGPAWVFFLVIPAFAAVGVWLLIYAISMGRRIAIVDVVGDTLLISQQGLRRSRQWEWRAADLRSVHVGPSGMEVNDKPVMALIVEPFEGGTVRLFAERRDEDLRWIAGELVHALGLDAQAAMNGAA